MSKRAQRRHHYQRLKKKEWNKARAAGWRTDEKSISKSVSVHGAGCSCHMCGNPRKYWNEKTQQEKRADLDENKFLN